MDVGRGRAGETGSSEYEVKHIVLDFAGILGEIVGGIYVMGSVYQCGVMWNVEFVGSENALSILNFIYGFQILSV